MKGSGLWTALLTVELSLPGPNDQWISGSFHHGEEVSYAKEGAWLFHCPLQTELWPYPPAVSGCYATRREGEQEKG